MKEGQRNEDSYLGSSLRKWQMTGTKFTALNLGSGSGIFLFHFLPKVVIVELSGYRGSGCEQARSSYQGLRGFRGWLRGPERQGKQFLI